MSYKISALGAVGSRWGQVVTKDGFRYQITEEDVLWAARAAQCEGGGEASHKATLWTWTARFTLPNYRRRFRTLASLIRAHSQPVNPIWTRTGSKCAPGGRYHGTDYCSASKLRRREACASRAWDSIAPGIREAVTKWATAKLPNPVPKAVDFASSSIGHSADDIEIARFSVPGARHSNVFYSESASRSRPANFVTIHQDGRVAGPTIAGVIRAAPYVGVAAIGIAAVFAGWAWWRYGRRR